MKKLILVLLPLFLIVLGCSQESTISSPDYSIAPQNVTWIEFSAEVQSLSLKKHLFGNELIQGHKGGHVKIQFEENLLSGGKFKIDADLKVEKDSFSPDSTLDFSVILDDQTTTSTFGPSPYSFQKPLKFDFKFEGA